MNEHVDAEIMSAFREDLLPERQAARVAAHLAACSRCADLDAQLANVSTLLASAPAPPMPPALTSRIEAALAAEAAARAAAGRSPAGQSTARTATVPSSQTQVPAASASSALSPEQPLTGPPVTGPPADGARGAHRARRGWSPGLSRLALRVGAVAATIVVVAGAGYGLVRLAAGSQSSPSANSGSAARQAQSSRSFLSEPAPQRAPGAPNLSFPVVASGTDYQPGQIASQASAVLARSSVRSGLAASSGTEASAFGGFKSVRACVKRVTGGTSPKLVDVARYRGQTALIVMIPADRGSVRVLVVGAGCSASASDVLARASLPSGG